MHTIFACHIISPQLPQKIGLRGKKIGFVGEPRVFFLLNKSEGIHIPSPHKVLQGEKIICSRM